MTDIKTAKKGEYNALGGGMKLLSEKCDLAKEKLEELKVHLLFCITIAQHPPPPF